MGSLFPALSTAFIGVFALCVAQLWPPSVGNYVILFSPSVGEAEKITHILDAGGQIIDQLGGGVALVVATSDPGFKDEIMEQGAWLIFDAAAGFGCATTKDVHAFSKSQF